MRSLASTRTTCPHRCSPRAPRSCPSPSGALAPLLPYLLGANSLLPGLGITLLALFVCGAVVTRLTTRSWLFGGLRQLLLGGAAAGLTYVVGAAVGANLG